MANSVFLLDFLDLGRTFSTGPVDFATTEQVIPRLSNGGLQSLSWSLDERTDTGRLGGLSARLLNQDALIHTFDEHVLENTRVRLRHGFDDLPEADFLTLMTGVVDRYTVGWDSIDFSIILPDVKEDVPLSVPVDTNAFPSLPQTTHGGEIPVVIGAVTKMPLLLVVPGVVAGAGTNTYVVGLSPPAYPLTVSHVYVNGEEVSFTADTALAQSQVVCTVDITTPLGESVVTADVTGPSGGHPVDVLIHLLTRFVPAATYDPASFAAAKALTPGWTFAAALTAPGNSTALLQRLAQQARLMLYRGNAGEYRLAVLHPNTDPVRNFDPTNIVTQSLTRESGPVDTIYTSYYVYYQGHGVSSTATDFQANVYATPTESNFTGATNLVLLCATAKAAYGVDHKLEVFAEWIQDAHTANLLLNFLVQRYSAGHDLVTFTSWWDVAPMTLGHRVTVTHDLVPGGGPVEAQVVGVTLQPGALQGELQARLHAPIVDDA